MKGFDMLLFTHFTPEELKELTRPAVIITQIIIVTLIASILFFVF